MLRMNLEYKKNELQQNINHMRIMRKHKKYKCNEKLNNVQRIRELRQSLRYKYRLSLKDKVSRQEKRDIDVLKFRDNLYNYLLNQKDDNTTAKWKWQFIKCRMETPSFICCCCEGLFFKSAVVKLNELRIEKANAAILSQINNFPSGFICGTCKNYAYRGKVYKLSTSNGLKFPTVPKSVKELTDLEERMVAPILNFMQIRALKPYALNPQLGLKGSVVNIQIDVNNMLEVLPRKFTEMETIQLKLKRHKDHKSDYMFESVRPGVICKALQHLVKTPLYVKYAIKVDEKYFQNYASYGSEEINFIVDNNDEVDEKEMIDNMELENKHAICLDQINNDEVLLVDNNAEVAEGHSSVVNIIAPGQGKYPLPWHKMDDLDELCFPRIFAGYSFNLPKSVSYLDRIRSEVRRYDRRSCIPSRILFMAKKCLEISCLSSINVCLRRIKMNTNKNLRASDVLNPEFMNNLIEFDDGFKLLKNIRSSPAYWEQKKKELLAMIRQLGKPTFFMTVSAAESYWPELLQTLMKYRDGGKTLSVQDAFNLDYNTKTDLIRNDPVTCARYFDHKAHKLMWLLRQKESIFGEYEVVDSYERVEIQQRGSPHEHIFLWLKGAPMYNGGKDKHDHVDNKELIDLIDRFITCRYDENNPYIKFQMHKHNHSCYKGQKNKRCRFHIPYPVMRRTMILEPLNYSNFPRNQEVNKNEIAHKSYKLIDNLMNEFYKKKIVMSYDEILEKLNMTDEEYLLAIRSSLKQKRVFLKRSSLEVNINGYNADILQLFESNMDLQFVLDEYSAVSYVTNYISKIEGGLSKLLREAAIDCDNNNKTVREKFRKITNVFLNSNLMSAQEAAYHVLSLPLSKQSRKTVYINTNPISERVLMLKSENALKKLNAYSTEIYMDDIFDKYSRRDIDLHDVCLADFAANYQKITKKKQEEGDADNNDENDEVNDFRFRQRTAVIRYRRYKLKQDPSNYYREKILLFMPWLDETSEVENIDHEMVYKNNINVIERNQEKFSIISDTAMDDALEQVENDNREIENQKAEQCVSKENSCTQHIDIFKQGGEQDNANEKKNIKKDSHKSRYTCPPRVNENELHDMVNELNCKQKEFVMHTLNCFKLHKVPFKIFLSGSAGVGKSRVINTLYQLITNYFDKLPGGDMDKIIVLLCAPSGKAAFLINGVTIHSAFALPINQFGVSLPQLSSDLANNIREKLSKVQLLIIDEISMVSSTVLGYIDTRLRQINGINESFGGLSVLAVGDLNQLPPVRDKPVYQVSRRNEMAPFIDINPLWNEFEFYELTEVMRQKDDLAFISALNNLALGEMSEDDIKLIKSREIKNQTDVPHTAIRLYATNANVTAYNNRKISQCKSELIISTAENTFSKNIDESTKKFILQSLKKQSFQNELLTELKLKIDIKYMIINNIDVEDGLVNGACGILKFITFQENTKIPSILWLDFQLSRVGVKLRTRYRNYMKNANIEQNLTPIIKISNQVNMSTEEKYQITRSQFPVVPAEAITIHKSQGQTYEKVCLDFKKSERRTLQMLYVALSRVSKFSGLYIWGQFKLPVSKKTKINTTNPANDELHRLRKTKQLKLSFNHLVNENGLIVIYQNIGTLTSKLIHINKDSWFHRSDILIFSETLTKTDDELNILNYDILFRSDIDNNSRGLICYGKTKLSIEKLFVEQEFSSNAHVELFTFKIRNYYIISGYKSPKATNSMFGSVVQRIMNKITIESEKILIGDFNYNLLNCKDNGNNYLINLLNKYNLKTKLPSKSITTDLNTQIDVIFSNVDDIDCGVYETYFSYHKPIYAILDKKVVKSKKEENLEKTDVTITNQKMNPENFTIFGECLMISDQHIEQNNHEYAVPADCFLDDGYNYALETAECKEVIKPDCYLQDKHINLFHEIMNRTLNERGIYNFAQDTGYVRAFLSNLQEIPEHETNIQIIYTGEIGKKVVGHWICTRSDGNGNVHIYDSLNANHLNHDVIDYLNALYKYKKEYIFHRVQYQNNAFDCGAFAIYFATLLCYNREPSEQRAYDVGLMRRHIANILMSRKLLNFPENI